MSDDETDETLSRRRRKLRDSYARSMLARALATRYGRARHASRCAETCLAEYSADTRQRPVTARSKTLDGLEPGAGFETDAALNDTSGGSFHKVLNRADYSLILGSRGLPDIIEGVVSRRPSHYCG